MIVEVVLALGDGGVGLGVVYISIAASVCASGPAAIVESGPMEAIRSPVDVDGRSALFPLASDEAEVNTTVVVVVKIELTFRMIKVDFFLG